MLTKLKNTPLLVLAALLATGCGGGTNFRAPAVNLPPSISVIDDATVQANSTPLAIGFTVADDSTDGGTLRVTVSSDTLRVINADGIVVTINGGDRTLTLSPPANTVGTSAVTVTVTDAGGLSTATGFLLTVTPIPTSFVQFARDTFTDNPSAIPRPVNHLDFQQDAGVDDFVDLL